MEKLTKFAKTIRNNWKKSLVGAFALYYAGATAKERYEISILMRAACKEAAKHGDALIPIDRNPTMMTVILNPVANKRSAKKEYEKYCEPLLHLAGIQVEVVQTTAVGNAKEIVETLKGTEAIIVAGGDGTLSETITGLLRRTDGANQFPLGVLPLGRTNTIANTMFPSGEGVDKVKQIIEACMAIINGNTTWKDAMKIEPIISEEDETPSKPIYAMSAVEWGAFRDTWARRDKYWFLGSLRDYATFIFNGYKDSITWNCSGTLKYTPPCTGCTNCVEKRPEVGRKWSFFMPIEAQKQAAVTTENPECDKLDELCFKTCDFKINTDNVRQSISVPSLNVVLGKNMFSYNEFVSEGWRRLKGQTSASDVIPVRTVELLPKKTAEGAVYEIDNEEFDVKPVRITLLPKVVKLFCR